jgi:hypothetical protein
MKSVTRSSDGSALNLDGSDPSFALRKSGGMRPRALRRRLRLRVTTTAGSFFTVNVSPGGLCTEQMRVLAAGTLFVGSIHLDGQNVPFTGRVAWARSGDSRLNQLGRMGVTFGHVDVGFAQGLMARDARSVASAC